MDEISLVETYLEAFIWNKSVNLFNKQECVVSHKISPTSMRSALTKLRHSSVKLVTKIAVIMAQISLKSYTAHNV